MSQAFEESDIAIVRIDEKRYFEHGVVILIGHIVHTDIQDTIDSIDNTGYKSRDCRT
ncbi:MAG: hypothetical protein R2741_07520 [Methanolobus sp.]